MLGRVLVPLRREERLHQFLEQLSVVRYLEVQQFMDNGFGPEVRPMTIRPMETTAHVSWREDRRHDLVRPRLADSERQDT